MRGRLHRVACATLAWATCTSASRRPTTDLRTAGPTPAALAAPAGMPSKRQRAPRPGKKQGRCPAAAAACPAPRRQSPHVGADQAALAAGEQRAPAPETSCWGSTAAGWLRCRRRGWMRASQWRWALARRRAALSGQLRHAPNKCRCLSTAPRMRSAMSTPGCRRCQSRAGQAQTVLRRTCRQRRRRKGRRRAAPPPTLPALWPAARASWAQRRARAMPQLSRAALRSAARGDC